MKHIVVRLRKQHIIVESPLNVDELDHKMFLLAAGAGAQSGITEAPAKMKVDLARARQDIQRVKNMPLLDKRIQVFEALVENCRNALQYQYLLDFMKGGRLKRPIEFQQHLTDITEWRAIKEVARREMDSSIVLAELLESNRDLLIDTAKTQGGESIRVLGPDLAKQLRRKVQIMAAHWEDYERLFDEEKK